jgi:hypothetical protein
MQIRTISLGLAIAPLLVSYATQPLTLAPIGPAPAGGSRVVPPAAGGQLQVFTETDEYEYDHDVPFFPHRDYQIYTTEGKHLMRVWNSHTHEDETPVIVDLPAGKYVIKADAEFYGPVTVPVVIRPNQTTKVILQPGWSPGKTVASSEVVRMPNGYAVGWRGDLGGEE